MGALLQWIADRWTGRKSKRALDREIELKVQMANARRAQVLADPKLSPLERMIEGWGVGTAQGASDNDLYGLEEKYAVRLPEDFRAYLKAAPNGNDWDHVGTNWWPLSQIKTVRQECADLKDYVPLGGGDKQLIFADYLMWCCAWAVDCSETENRGRVIFLGEGDSYVADSFDDFLDRYLRDNNSIFA
ncbi:MAG: SMI1/KNR4 family protein [Novosphingobium sp.]